MKKIILIALFATTTLLVNAQLSVVSTSTNVTCYNACNGTASLAPSGGVPPYSFAWTPIGNTTQTVTGLCNGTYTAYVYDSIGNVAQTSITITQPTQISITATMVAATCSTCCDGSANGTATGGNPPYTYSWAPNSSTSQNPTTLCVGPHNYCVTDASGCTVCIIITIGNSVGIQDPAIVGEFDVFPNPASTTVSVNESFLNPTSIVLSVTSVLGEVVYVKAYESASSINETIDLTGFSAGSYFISLKTDSGNSVRQLIVE